MARKHSKPGVAPQVRAQELPEEVYNMYTPKWQAYYHRMRSTVRFPRYYKKALNW